MGADASAPAHNTKRSRRGGCPCACGVEDLEAEEFSEFIDLRDATLKAKQKTSDVRPARTRHPVQRATAPPGPRGYAGAWRSDSSGSATSSSVEAPPADYELVQGATPSQRSLYAGSQISHSHFGGISAASNVGSCAATSWSTFTAEHARGRAHQALNSEVEHVLQCIGLQCDHGRVSMTILCADHLRHDLLVQELRKRFFTVVNPIRKHYEIKAQHLISMKGRIALPVLPEGAEAEELLLRVLYSDPVQAEKSYAGVAGTFKVCVDVSLDPQTENGQSYFFGPETQLGSGCKDSRLLLKVSW